MKRIFVLFIILSVAGCNEQVKKENIQQEEAVAIKETIRNDEVHIQLNDTTESFFTNLRTHEFQDRPDMVEIGKGTGLTSVTIPTKTKIHIVAGSGPASYRYSIEFDRGDSVIVDSETVRFDDKNEISISLFKITNSTRNWSEINFENLLYKKNVHTKAIGIDTTKSFFFTYWNSEEMYENAISFLDSLRSQNEISESFYLEEKNNQKYNFASKKLRNGDIELKESQNTFLIGDLEIRLDDETQIKNSSFISFLREVIDFRHFNNRREQHSKKFDFLLLDTPTFLNAELKIAVLDSYLKSIFLLEKNKFPAYLEKFKEVNSKPGLENKWNEVLVNLEKNQKILNTSNRNIGILLNMVNDNELTFEEILQSQRGKVVLVDFWASWCVPCIKEMPDMKKVKSIFEKDKFQVIEISIDKDYAAWERVSRMQKLDKEEHSYIITNWDNSNLYKTYSIKTIPRYLLFDKEGNIISEDAPRPSSIELKDLITASI